MRNYSKWSSELENALCAKRKIGFIRGSLTIPSKIEKPTEAKVWKTVNSIIVGWIRASISPHVRSTITFTPIAQRMWTDLKKIFYVGNIVRVHQLKAELAMCRHNRFSVMDYFGRLSSKWEELQTSKQIPKCTCKASAELVKIHEEEKVHQFIMGLDDSRFGNVCTNIIAMEPLLDLNSAYQRVIREERRLNTTCFEPRTKTMDFTVKAEINVSEVATMNGVIVAVTHNK